MIAHLITVVVAAILLIALGVTISMVSGAVAVLLKELSRDN